MNLRTAAVLGFFAVSGLLACGEGEIEGPVDVAPGIVDEPYVASPSVTRQTIVVSTGPDLRVLNVSLPVSAVVRNGTAPVTATVCNNGTLASPASSLSILLSTDASVSTADPVIATGTLPQLDPGACTTHTLTATFKEQSKSYYLAAWADRADSINEELENNNVLVGPTVYVGSRADLTVSFLNAPPVAAPSTPFTVAAQVCNIGSASASSTRVEVRLSTDSTINTADTLISNFLVGTVAAGECRAVNTSASGAAASQRWIGLRMTTSSTEVSTANNTALGPQFAIGVGPDWVLNSVGGTLAAGELSLSARVCNQGTAAAPATLVKWVLSTDASMDAGDVLVTEVPVPALAVSACADATGISTPTGILGDRTLLAQVNPAGPGAELLDINNVLSGPTFSLGADLTISALQVTAAEAGLRYDAVICNAGTVNAPSSSLRLLASQDAVVGNDVTLTSIVVPALASGSCVSLSEAFSPPAVVGGSYFVFGTADEADAVAESDEGNNVRVSPPLGIGPDLVVSTVNGWMSGGNFLSSVRVCNVGNVASPPSSQLTTVVRLSPDPAADPSDEIVDVFTHPSLHAGACIDLVSSRTPATRGELHVLANIDESNAITELDESNNAGAAVQTVQIAPDFAIEGLTGTVSGTTLTANITVCNRGTVPASGSATAYLQGLDTGWPTEIPTLAPGVCTVAQYDIALGMANGTFSLRAYAYASSGEHILANNYFTGPELVLQPDFTIEGLTGTMSGTTLTANITVCNRGTVPSDGSASARLRDMDAQWTNAPDVDIEIPTLAAGACTVAHGDIEFASLNGRFALEAHTFASGSESNWDNNFFTGPELVLQPDFTIEGLTGTVSGTTLTANITVCNRGTAPSNGSAMPLLRNVNGGWMTAPDVEIEIPTLAAGTCTVAHGEIDFGSLNGTFALEARTTPFRSESNWDNNFFTGPEMVLQPDFTIEGLTRTVLATTLTANITVCNRGTIPSNGSARAHLRDMGGWGASAPDTEIEIPTLPAGACTVAHVDIEFASLSGTFALEANTYASRPESNWDNNFFTGPELLVLQPDFSIEGLTGSVSGMTLTAQITVCNRGTVPASGTARAHLRAVNGWMSAPDVDIEIPSLAAGACTVTHGDIEFAYLNGTFALEANAYAYGSESNWDNNFFMGPELVLEPDFSIEGLTGTVSGTTLTANITLCNRGTVAASGIARAFLDGVTRWWPNVDLEIPPLEVGTCTVAHYDIEVPPFMNSFTLTAEGFASSGESNWDNNYFVGPQFLLPVPP